MPLDKTHKFGRDIANLAGPLATVAMILAGCNTAAQSQASDPVAGRGFAGHICAECHNIDGSSSEIVLRGPDFTDLAERYRKSTDRLRLFLRKPHGEMPEIPLSPDEIDDLISYLLAVGE